MVSTVHVYMQSLQSIHSTVSTVYTVSTVSTVYTLYTVNTRKSSASSGRFSSIFFLRMSSLSQKLLIILLFRNGTIFCRWYQPPPQVINIARIANAVPVTLYSRVTMQLLILFFSIVRNVFSVASVNSQVTSLLDCSLRRFLRFFALVKHLLM